MGNIILHCPIEREWQVYDNTFNGTTRYNYTRHTDTSTWTELSTDKYTQTIHKQHSTVSHYVITSAYNH